MTEIVAPIDWCRVVLNLKSAGFSYAWVGVKVGLECGEPISRLARGEGAPEPRFSVGLALLNLHADHCPDKHNIEALKLDKAKRPYLRAVG